MERDIIINGHKAIKKDDGTFEYEQIATPIVRKKVDHIKERAEFDVSYDIEASIKNRYKSVLAAMNKQIIQYLQTEL